EYKVYGRVNEPCKICETPIKKSVIGQRGTFFCPTCQR
ncbi:MAG: zinc finger domain-containing protein, partial [Pelistega sp.]|nr:zinc finger domain-containing protein [Pelistega sp.]